jgi:hypothetical protein
MNAIITDCCSNTPEVLFSRIEELPAATGRETGATPEEDLAVGILTQAVYDLRRFHKPANSLERELYRDAHDWIQGADLSWPYSFTNICRLLDVPAETLRAELLADASLGWLAYWCKLGGRFARSFGTSLAGNFKMEPNAESSATFHADPIKS